MNPPIATTTKAKNKLSGKDLTVEICPSSPEIELNRIKALDNPPAVRGPANPTKSNSGVRKIPPPVPVNPESKPKTAPIINKT